MKIDPNLIIGNALGTTPVKKPAAENSFEEMLSGIEKSQIPRVHTYQEQIAQPSALNPYMMTALTTSEHALDLLDGYAQALEDPGLTLRSISPIVDKLEHERDRITSAASMLSDDDPLKVIMNELISTLDSEVIRFRRGDLLS
ncbi:MAG: hypothetical protein ACP5G0_09955 [Desulfomonilia bacterium]